jgi:hypothetical protein
MSSGGDQIHIGLEIERGAVPLSGRLTDDRGGARSFTGWMGLAATLSVVLEEAEGRVPPELER